MCGGPIGGGGGGASIVTAGLAETLKVNIKRGAILIPIRWLNRCQSCRNSGGGSRRALPSGKIAVFDGRIVNTNVQSGAETNTSVRYLHLTGGGSYHSPDKPRKLDYCRAVFSARLPSPLNWSSHVSRPIGVQTMVIQEGAVLMDVHQTNAEKSSWMKTLKNQTFCEPSNSNMPAGCLLNLPAP